jgi:hypothetical protein
MPNKSNFFIFFVAMKFKNYKIVKIIHVSNKKISDADPGCLSRILIFSHPGAWIPDPRSKNSNKRVG